MKRHGLAIASLIAELCRSWPSKRLLALNIALQLPSNVVADQVTQRVNGRICNAVVHTRPSSFTLHDPLRGQQGQVA